MESWLNFYVSFSKHWYCLQGPTIDQPQQPLEVSLKRSTIQFLHDTIFYPKVVPNMILEKMRYKMIMCASMMSYFMYTQASMIYHSDIAIIK